MKRRIRKRIEARKRRIERRLNQAAAASGGQPVFSARNVRYDINKRQGGVSHGGIALFHQLARKIGLIEAIDRRLHLLKFHLPYHESDHVLNFAFNALCEGTCLQDIEIRRNDECFLDLLGATRIPDPTTSGDFCRRFTEPALEDLHEAFHDARKNVWAEQPDAFFEQATLDMDGTLVETTGQCKQGIDIAYNGKWGYHPLLITLAETGELMCLVNRPGNRPSHEGAAERVDRCLEVCFEGGFRRVLLRGDTDFSQTRHLDRWNADPRVRFIFGYDARPNLVALADSLPGRAWKRLHRPKHEPTEGEPRQRPHNAKEEVVRRRGFDNLRTEREEVAETNYQPEACAESYRLVILKKHLTRRRGDEVVGEEVRYFFYLTNEWTAEPCELVLSANRRCHQENLIAQLSGGCHALRARVDGLVSNGAYMLMTSLAWNLKIWLGLSLPETSGRWRERHRREKAWIMGLEFRTFVQALVRVPCQLVRTGRRVVLRLLSWNPYQSLFFRLADAVSG